MLFLPCKNVTSKRKNVESSKRQILLFSRCCVSLHYLMQLGLYKPMWLNVIQIVTILDAMHFSLPPPQFSVLLCRSFVVTFPPNVIVIQCLGGLHQRQIQRQVRDVDAELQNALWGNWSKTDLKWESFDDKVGYYSLILGREAPGTITKRNFIGNKLLLCISFALEKYFVSNRSWTAEQFFKHDFWVVQFV